MFCPPAGVETSLPLPLLSRGRASEGEDVCRFLNALKRKSSVEKSVPWNLKNGHNWNSGSGRVCPHLWCCPHGFRRARGDKTARRPRRQRESRKAVKATRPCPGHEQDPQSPARRSHASALGRARLLGRWLGLLRVGSGGILPTSWCVRTSAWAGRLHARFYRRA